MNTFSLFQDEILAKELLEVINNEKPKSDLEKTEWWNFLVCQSLSDEGLQFFIKYEWPNIEPKHILHHLLQYYDCDKWQKLFPTRELKIHHSIENLLIDKKLIEIIKQEQKAIRLNHYKMKLYGSTPKPIPLNTKGGTINCVAILERHGKDVAYENIYSFLLDLSDNWVDGQSNGSRNIECCNQLNEEKDDEIAEIIFSNFPKTFDYCEQSQEQNLYVCSYNHNFTKPVGILPNN